MPITNQIIKQYCQSPRTYHNALQLQKSKAVRNLHIEEAYESDFIIAGEVIANKRLYKVKMGVDEDRVASECACSCGQYYWGICEHQAALLLEYVDQLKNGILKRITSKRIKDLIFDIAYKSKKEAFKSKLNGDIQVIPYLKVDYKELKVDFKVGNQKQYVIKNLNEFVENITDEIDFEYGKNLKFVHDKEAFTNDSQQLIDFITEYVDNYHHVAYMSSYHYQTKAIRSIILSSVDLDKFLEMNKERALTVVIDKQEHLCRIISKNPNIKFYIEKSEKGVEIYRDTSTIIMMGLKHVYEIQDNVIYTSDQKYKKEMEMLLEYTNRGEERKVYLSEEDYHTFCATVLPVISNYSEIEYKEIDFGQYMPPTTEIEVYLDAPENNYVTCTIYGKYGNEKYNVFEKFNPIEVYRDVKTECSAYIIGQKYFAGVTEAKEQEQAFFIKKNDNLLFHFLESGVSDFQEIADVYISDSFKNIKVLPSPKVAIGVSLESGLLELTLDTGEMPLNQLAGLLDSYKRRKKFHRLKNGQFINLEDSSFSTITELADGLSLTAKDLKQSKITLPQNRALYLDKILRESNEDVEYHRDIYFKNLIKNIKAVEDAEFEIPTSLKSILREYQKNGFRWLRTLTAYGFGGILADDMGLGKTLQIIALLLSQKEEAKTPSLIVCPASLIYNWESELEKFSPELKKCIVAGTARERKKLIQEYDQYDVLVTSYDLLKRDVNEYNNILFETEIIDEAQYIKNQSTQASKAVKIITAKVKFALTGTPIENRLSELWSIFDYLMPGLLYSYNHFREEIEIPIVQQNDEVSLKRLHRLISPFILRRLKKDVLKDLPNKLENVIYSKMEGKQLELYQANVALLKESIGKQSEDDFNKNKLQILSELTKLRQLCCDPALYYDSYVGGSAKLETCMDLIENGVNGGHKILLFSQFTTMFEIIVKRLDNLKISYFKLTGQTPKAKRYKMVEEFNQDDTKIFLISLKAGGTGLNLTGADIVIHYDPWWNISAQNQATDRAHRIGQKNVVSVFKLITKNTIEEKILNLQELKRDLADKVISEEGVSSASLDKKDLLELLG
ncbi:SNF2 family DNA or RNA helicase [Lachnotalea glycerini]|uniref:SNF2 family DNA or RNA helicase n=1 Tax=Lachnotalea glycerini TaxID=1763509 RepID=A0A318EUA7_9FIRM|nr:SNF2 helicase associated domain-containing protein [Lachnotalea glycerini]PXV91838.1 SNF2 family DNA or RNA helicase [Lachnotalea glycerini]